MKKKVVIVGSKGIIGGVLSEDFASRYEVCSLDLPEYDARDYGTLRENFQHADVVIHVAHGTDEEKRENWRSGKIDPTNILMELNTIHAALEANVPRLIVASSVHADNFNDHDGLDELQTPGSYMPASPYATHKVILEEMGKFLASRGLIEFIALRFGGVTEDNSVRTILREPQVWLSHRDLVAAVEACISAEAVPDGFATMYVVSDNDGRLHSTQNPFGWQPKDNSKDFM